MPLCTVYKIIYHIMCILSKYMSLFKKHTHPEIVRSSTVTDGAPRVRRPVNLGGIENDPSLRGPDSPIVNTTMSLGQLVTSDVPACKV